MNIKLRGGNRDGMELEIPYDMDVIEIPHIRPTYEVVEAVTADGIKRHSWDDDALTITTDKYRRTDKVVDGRTIYEVA